MLKPPPLPANFQFGNRATQWATAILIACITSGPTTALAQDKFPSRAVTIVVPFPAGASADFIARITAARLERAWGVPVIVENKTGAGGNIGADAVANSKPDGYTILLGGVSVVSNPTLFKKPSYVPEQLTPIGVGASVQLITIAKTGFMAKDIKGMISEAAAKPMSVLAASAGNGTLSHLGIEMLGSQNKVTFNHIPYRGSAPGLTAIMSGQADVMIDTVANAAPLVANGRVKALAVHSEQRSRRMPQVPTYAEAGMPDMSFAAWNAFLAPAGTPSPIIKSWNEALAKAITEPSIDKALDERAIDPVVQQPSEALQFMKNEAARWSKVIRGADVKL